ncbi:8-oxo-dGTP diphosphatase [Carnobacteriaceae bacterium zg-C25]|nr:8-oxo-dGTP diphosphatase [Carnobacteriaceae bacterium zg-C25]
MILATLCYIDNGREYLLLHRNKKEQDIHHGKWIGVGGKFEAGETPQECVVREVFEETGLTIQNPDLKGFIMFPKFDGTNDWGVFVFVAKTFTGHLIQSDEGDLEWVAYHHVLDKPTWKGDTLFLKWLLTDQSFFSAKIIYENGEFVTYSVDFKNAGI